MGEPHDKFQPSGQVHPVFHRLVIFAKTCSIYKLCALTNYDIKKISKIHFYTINHTRESKLMIEVTLIKISLNIITLN